MNAPSNLPPSEQYRGKDKSPRRVRDADSYVVRHGAARRGAMTPEYRIYHKMLRRCLNPNDPRYASYGGRGITVCSWWQESFANFLADVGLRPSPKHSLDRINNDSDYTPANVRWATAKQQSRNKRSTLFVEHDGRQMSAAEYCELTGLSYATFQYRLYQLGWPLDRATRLTDGRKSATK